MPDGRRQTFPWPRSELPPEGHVPPSVETRPVPVRARATPPGDDTTAAVPRHAQRGEAEAEGGRAVGDMMVGWRRAVSDIPAALTRSRPSADGDILQATCDPPEAFLAAIMVTRRWPRSAAATTSAA